MKAFVVDEDQVKKLGFVFLGIIIVVFLLGFYLGGKNLFSADKSGQSTQKNTVIEKKEQPAVSPVENSKKTANEKLKLASKKVEKEKVNKKSQKQIEKKPEKKVVKKIEKKTPVKKVVENKKHVKKTEDAVKVNKNKKKNEVVAAVIKKEEIITAKKEIVKKEIVVKDKKAMPGNLQALTETSGSDDGSSGQRIYSIQAGMFASETNANSFIEKLSAKQFDAYVSSFVSSSGAIKYNVRVGKFEQRDQARVLLDEFQKTFSSPAYVVIAQ